MRVEVQQGENEENSANSMRLLVNQLREITGIQDLPLLQRALMASQGDIIQAISLVTAPSEEAQTPTEPSGHTEEQHTHTAQQGGEAKDDLQAAIELSLQENQTADRPVEKIVIHVKRKRCEQMIESCSPADLLRPTGWPVGIRNIGNTCWFSAVIQSLFHLPVFRRLVLSYCLSERILEKCKSHSEKRNIAFMQELRCLFALMVGSTRRFVDPSAAVELLRDSFRTTESQQDVSEFTHKLLDWLEDAFQLSATGNDPQDKKDNPMVNLFYGTFVAKRTIEGKTQSNMEQFGQYPLQVNGFNNLDECLEGAMLETEVEHTHAGQERWFSKLPPVLTFELSRFEFNQSLGRPEKIHKKLEFPQVIYMDRYLHKNVELTQSRRATVRRLKEQLTALQQKMESYKNYGSGPVKYPLADVLQYMLEFATTRPNTNPSPNTNSSPNTGSTPNTGSSSPMPPTHTEASTDETPSDPVEATPPPPPDSPSPSSSPAQRTPIHKPFTHSCPPLDGLMQPAPHTATEEELTVIRACLQRWRTQVENDINELKTSIEKVTQELEQIYSDNSLCQVPYRLHAVLVHEGQASAGHYWSYIFQHERQRWLKYNDVVVTEATWEELVRDSYGGMTNASAYCLMYINDSQPHLIEEDTDGDTGQVVEGVDALPPQLRRYVLEDNRWFQQQLREWEEQLSHQEAAHTHTQQPPHPEDQQEPEQEPEQDPEQEPNQDPEPESEQEPEDPEQDRDQDQEPDSNQEPNQEAEDPEPEHSEPEHSEPEHSKEPREEPSSREPRGSGPGEADSETDYPRADSPESGPRDIQEPSEPVFFVAMPPDPNSMPRPDPTPMPSPFGTAPNNKGIQGPTSPTGTQVGTSNTISAHGDTNTMGTRGGPSPMPTTQTSSPMPTTGTQERASMPTERPAGEGSTNAMPRQSPARDSSTSPEQGTTQNRATDGEGGVAEGGASEEAEVPQHEEVLTDFEIPNVGKIQVLSNTEGFNEEMILTPAMQGIILAIAKASKVIDKDGPEAGLIAAFHEEYSRLYALSQESSSPQQDPRLQHILIYMFQNRAPKRIIERTLLEQFGDRNLSFDDRSISIMREARSKIRLIKPEDMDMEEYLKWHDDYSMFKTVFAYLLTGLEQYQHGKLREALTYLAHAYQDNSILLRGGDRRGVEQTLISLYRRKCLMELNEGVARVFRGAEHMEAGQVDEGVAVVNDVIIPCLQLMSRESTSVCQEDLDAIEHIRSVWCSLLGQDINESLQEKLSEFLPRVLDCSAERVVLQEPPKLFSNSPHDLESRLAAVMESIGGAAMVTVT